MNKNQIVQEDLLAFKKLNKFSFSAWKERYLNPSSTRMCLKLDDLFNTLTDDLIEESKVNFKSAKYKSILKKGLSRFNVSDYDTEEREFICFYFIQLSKIVSVDFQHHVNTWMNGIILSTAFKIYSLFKRKEKAIENLSQICTDCGSKLEVYILERQEGIPDNVYMIIRCNVCSGYNLLSVGPNIKKMQFGNYKFIEQLMKSEFTEEQAKARLEQVRLYRK